MMLRVGMRSVEDEKINWEHQTREETKQLITYHGRTTKNVLVVVQADCGQGLVGWDGLDELQRKRTDSLSNFMHLQRMQIRGGLRNAICER